MGETMKNLLFFLGISFVNVFSILVYGTLRWEANPSLQDKPTFFEKNFTREAASKRDTLLWMEHEISQTESKIAAIVKLNSAEQEANKKELKELALKLESLKKNKKNTEALYKIYIYQAQKKLLEQELLFYNKFGESTAAKDGTYTREDLLLDQLWLQTLNDEL